MKNKKGVVLIYVLFLVTLTIVFATIILNNNSYLFNISQYFDLDSKLYSNINSDSKISVDINRDFNSNGSGFIDNVSCPSGTSISMSGNTIRDDIGSVLVNSGHTIFCSGTYQSNPLKLYFDSGFTDIIEADYNGYIVSITNGIGNNVFGDADSTLIDFSSSNYLSGDGFDDDFNSDNYMVTSTGNTSTGTYYLNNFQDDDNLGRKMIFGYVSIEFGFKKIFWDTFKVAKMINDNSNNNDLLNLKLGDITNGLLYFDIDKSSEMMLVKFDKNIYNESNELVSLGTLTGSLLAGMGYLQNESGNLALSGSITGNEYIFDFLNNDYAIFLKNTGTGTLLYKIKGETIFGTGIYLNPIDDSDKNIVRYLGNEILIDKDSRFISKEIDLIYKK